MKVRYDYLWNVCSCQDGVIRGDEMFNFNDRGNCYVYSLSERKKTAEFTLDKKDIIVPHCNAVCFGSEYYESGDEFPLLYANIYNNYAGSADRMEGTCLVYRLMREGGNFSTALIQIIRVGFTENLQLWKSLPDNKDVRSYGNFTVDTDNGKLYAFVMRDKYRTTRFFRFTLPKSNEGVICEKYGVPIITLGEDMIEDMFDTEYSMWLQGACWHKGRIYSVEGFQDEKNAPALRIIDPAERKQEAFIDLWGDGLKNEPEFIDAKDGVLYFRDGSGEMYTICIE